MADVARSLQAAGAGEYQMSQEMEDGQKAFSTFRVLNGDANILERDQLFRNMAQLYSYVSDRCDDEQVAQYDEVLCQLAELVLRNRDRANKSWPYLLREEQAHDDVHH